MVQDRAAGRHIRADQVRRIRPAEGARLLGGATGPEAPEGRRHRRGIPGDAARLVVSTALTSVLSLAGWAVVPTAWGWTPYVVLSGSMSPLVRPGDVVVAAPLRRSDRIQNNDVVVIDPEPGRSEPVTHRVVGRRPDGTYETKGDANPAPDTRRLTRGEIRAKARLVVPLLGLPFMKGTRAAFSGVATAPAAGFGSKAQFYAQAVIASGPVSYWRLGESSTTAGTDQMGTANLTLSNSPTRGITPGAVVNDTNAATNFSATATSYATAANASALSIAGAFSATAWVRTSTVNTGLKRVLIKWDNTNLNYALAWSSDGLSMRFLMDLTSNGRQTLTSALNSDGAWHQLTGTYDGTTMKLYLDGALATSQAATGALKTVTSPVTISAPSNPMTGDIDEVAVWSRALSASEVAQFYALATT